MDAWINPETGDYYPEVEELGCAYGRFQLIKDAARSQARKEARAGIEARTVELLGDAEKVFAQKIKDAVDSGMPQSWVRGAILRTSDWTRWKYWRNLAGLKPERRGWAQEED